MREFSVQIDVGNALTASNVEEAEAMVDFAADAADLSSSVLSLWADGWGLQTIVEAETEDDAKEKATALVRAVAAASGLPQGPITDAVVTDPISSEELETLLAAARER